MLVMQSDNTNAFAAAARAEKVAKLVAFLATTVQPVTAQQRDAVASTLAKFSASDRKCFADFASVNVPSEATWRLFIEAVRAGKAAS